MQEALRVAFTRQNLREVAHDAPVQALQLPQALRTVLLILAFIVQVGLAQRQVDKPSIVAVHDGKSVWCSDKASTQGACRCTDGVRHSHRPQDLQEHGRVIIRLDRVVEHGSRRGGVAATDVPADVDVKSVEP